MSFRFRNLAIPLSLVLAVACGDDGGGGDNGGGNGGGGTPDAGDNNTPDGGGNAGECAEFDTPAMVLDTYPANFAGNLVGAGRDLNVGEGVCDVEDSYFSQDGEDLVVQLNNLSEGTEYVVQVDSADDVAFYVATSCSNANLVAGDCLFFTDAELGNAVEAGTFTAPAGGTAYVVIDHFDPDGMTNLEGGAFTLSVFEPECLVDDDCSGTPDTPFCSDFTCVACTNSTQCDTTAAPVCDVGGTNACIAGFDSCTGDDAVESADDGPAGAVVLDPGAQPDSIDANICSDPLAETDHYKFTVTEGESRVLSLDWTGEVENPDLDLVVIDSEGGVVGTSFFDKPEVVVATELPAGDYFAIVSRFESEGMPTTAAVPYTITASIPECEDSFDCTNAQNAFCGADLTCQDGPEECTGDDANEPNNDGPAGAVTLTDGVAVDAAICNTPATERDYYEVTLGATSNLDVTVTFANDGVIDLDVFVFDENGELLGLTFYQNPETINLTFLPAGTYFIEVQYFGDAVTAAAAYSITADITGGVSCNNATDCAAEHSTQIYRGNCDAGACQFIDGAGALADGAACDTADDCTSGVCSYITFQQNAQTSICSTNCADDTDCSGLSGTSCTIPFQNNFCHPDCTDNLECGANPGSATLDSGEPWDYLTCSAGACDI